jgi:ABC-type glycerol-3-phosphate transport system substrate-binding protein
MYKMQCACCWICSTVKTNRFDMKLYFLVFLIPLIAFSGCAGLPVTASLGTPTPGMADTPPITQVIPTMPAVQTPTGPVALRLWLPPEFDPSADNVAAKLLQTRLKEFQSRRNIQIEVRIKALEGEGGMINALTTASSAAPLAMPDLVLLSRPALETAALKGLLYSFDDFTKLMDDPDWFEYSRQLAHIQENTYGIPFAGDALVMLYRPGSMNWPLNDWEKVLSAQSALLFPAGDTQAFFTLAEYEASGGAIQDNAGRPMLDQKILTNVLTFFQQAQAAGKMHYWLSQFENDQQAWQAYLDNRGSIVISWSSRYLKELPIDTAATLLPTPEGKNFTLATGWVWALTSINLERRSLSAELAEFLVTSDFCATWSEASGYLPPRPSSLQKWRNNTSMTLVNEIETSAHLIPPSDVLVIVGQVLEEATIKVLKQESDAVNAAQEAIKRIESQ